MKCAHFIVSLILYPICIFANPHSYSTLILNKTMPTEKNTIDRTLSNEKEIAQLQPNQRSMDYPTHVIRMSKVLENIEMTCAEVNNQIDNLFVNKITKDKFSYTTYVSCTYDADTQLASKFTIYSYFDPLNDDAIAYLKSYLDEYNGSNFLGAQLVIEPVKALVVSLNLSVGIKKNPNTPPFIQYREDRSDFYFKNNYELQTNLIADAKQRFLSDEPDQVLPFLDKWIFNHAGTLYRSILRDSNYALLEPERIFLMEHGDPIFVSPIKYYYAHLCDKYEHHHCLKQDLYE